MRDLVLRGEHPLAALSRAPGALAVITGADGGFRPVGTMMAVLGSGARIGDLTNGCIEGDVAVHAAEAMRDGKPRQLRYGTGSPFMDIRLPCGGGIDVTIVPVPDVSAAKEAEALRAARSPFAITLQGGLSIAPFRATGWEGGQFAIGIRPALRIVTFGIGSTAETFAALARAAGFDAVMGETTLPETDARTAIALFFHDHDREIPILLQALRTPALYIGAQGSRRAAAARADALRNAGATEEQIARIHGPVGLIPQARDDRVLAVSVLAEILVAAGEGHG